LGTNPIAIAIPNADHPIIADVATSAKTFGELMLMAQVGEKVDFGYVIDKNGNPSQDPANAVEGAQVPMAGHKGYALAAAIDVLAGLFVGGGSSNEGKLGLDGFMAVAFKPDLFISAEDFAAKLEVFINKVKSSHAAPGFERVRMPGEGALQKIEEGLKRGTVEVRQDVYEEIMKAGD